jgi:two-component system OmpR family response regulator
MVVALRCLAGPQDVAEVDIVAEAQDGAAALSVLERGGVDPVLLDVQMPELSGLRLPSTPRIRKL